jgi:hypothetical protein
VRCTVSLETVELLNANDSATDGLMGMLTKLLPGVDMNALVQKQVAPPKA